MEDTNDMPLSVPSRNRRPLKLAIALFGVALLVAGIYGYYALQGADVAELPLDKRQADDISQLQTEGNVLYQSGDVFAARSKYEEALAQEDSVYEEARLRLLIAQTIRDEGEYVEAARQYKAIALDERYDAVARAYAVQALGVLGDYGDLSAREEIFREEPFLSLYNPANPSASYRRVFDYAITLAPLPISQLRVGMWYARELAIDKRKADPVFSEEIAERYRDRVERKLVRGRDADMLTTKEYPFDDAIDRRVDAAYAITVGWFALAGFRSIDEADAAYKSAVDGYNQEGIELSDITLRIRYANFLSLAGRGADVKEVLAPLSSDPRYTPELLKTYLEPQQAYNMGLKENALRIAQDDEAFRALLVTLGWTEADFSTFVS